MSQLEPMVQQLQNMASLEALPEFFAQIQQQFDYPFCGLVLWRSQQKVQQLSAGHNDDFQMFAGTEQLQQCCLKRCTPALSSDIGIRTAFALAHDALLIPVKGIGTDYGVLVIGVLPTQKPLAQQISWYWTIIANYLYEAVYRLTRHHEDDSSFGLTSREKSCLSWAAKGKTSWEISQILSISERTVNFHLSNCISKTNSCNRQQAISRCLSAGHIHI